MKHDELRAYSGQKHWKVLEDEWDPDANDGAGAAIGFYKCGRIRSGDGEWLVCMEHWRGLFGSVPGGWRPEDHIPGDAPVGQVLATMLGLPYIAQIQEITQIPGYVLPGKDWRRLPGAEDLHQLTPSASFEGSRGPIWYPPEYAVWFPKGTVFSTKYLASQKDRGAHVNSVYWTSKVDPLGT